MRLAWKAAYALLVEMTERETRLYIRRKQAGTEVPKQLLTHFGWAESTNSIGMDQ